MPRVEGGGVNEGKTSSDSKGKSIASSPSVSDHGRHEEFQDGSA